MFGAETPIAIDKPKRIYMRGVDSFLSVLQYDLGKLA